MYSALRRYYCVVGVALFNEIEIGSVDTPVVAGVEDVIAVVHRVIGNQSGTLRLRS